MKEWGSEIASGGKELDKRMLAGASCFCNLTFGNSTPEEGKVNHER
jgi:hypothetical protein